MIQFPMCRDPDEEARSCNKCHLNDVFLYTFIQTMNPDGPPPKKKRRGKRGTLYRTTDLYDVQEVRTTVEYTTRGPGYAIKSTKFPIRGTDLQPSSNPSTSADNLEPQPQPEVEPTAIDDEDLVRVTGNSKVCCDTMQYTHSLIFVQTQADYMREFIKHAPHLLDGLLAREYIEADTLCSHCSDSKIGRWRCRDCTSPRIMCRRCMRRTHRENGLHRIEYWSGEFFRPAQLWEVGSYILVPHCSGEEICRSLALNKTYLEDFQQPKDDEDRTQPATETPSQEGPFTAGVTSLPDGDAGTGFARVIGVPDVEAGYTFGKSVFSARATDLNV